MIALTLLLIGVTAPETDNQIERRLDCTDLTQFFEFTNGQDCEDVSRIAFDPNTSSRAVWFRHNITLYRLFFVSNRAPVFYSINHSRGERIFNFRLGLPIRYRASPGSAVISLPAGTIVTIAFDENDSEVVKWVSTTLRYTMGRIWRLA